MTRLPVELIDEILALAVDLGTIKASEVSRICTRWRCFQRLLFKSISLDPFEKDILDLTLPAHKHLASYIEELQVIPHSASCRSLHNSNKDLPPFFWKFLSCLTNPREILFHDVRLKWTSLPTSSRNSLLAALQCNSFRSLAVSLTDLPLPSWVLPSASILTLKFPWYTLPPLFEGPIPEPCSLTHLILVNNTAIQRIAEFCVQQPVSAKVLLNQLNHLSLEDCDTYLEPTIAPFLEDLIVFLGTQLKTLDLGVRVDNAHEHATFPASAVVFRHLDSLQQLNIRLTGFSIRDNALQFAKHHIPSVCEWLPAPFITSLSLRVVVHRLAREGDSIYSRHYPDLLQSISLQLNSDKWRSLASASVLVGVKDRSRAPQKVDEDVTICTEMPKLRTLLRITHPRTKIVAAVPWV